MSDLQSVLRDIFERDIRVDRLIWLPGHTADVGSDLTDFLFNEDEETQRELLGFAVADDAPSDEIIELLQQHKRNGFLAHVATPKPTYISKTSWESSFGYCFTKWFYADTVAALMKQALAWQAQVHHVAKLNFKQAAQSPA